MNKKSSLWPTTKSSYETALNKQLPSYKIVNNKNRNQQNDNKKRKQDQIETLKKSTTVPYTMQPAPKKTKTESNSFKQQQINAIIIPGTKLTNIHVGQFLRIISNTSEYYPVPPFHTKELKFSLLNYLEYLTPSLLETNHNKQSPLSTSTLSLKRPGQQKQNPFKHFFNSLQPELIVHVVSFLDIKSIYLVSRANKSFYEMIGRCFEFIMEESCHFHFHPSKAQDMEQLIKDKTVKYLTGKGFPMERVLSSSQSLKYLELNVGESLELLATAENVSYPSLTHLKLQGKTVNNFDSSIVALQPLFEHLNGLTIEQPDRSTNELLAACGSVSVLNIKTVFPSTLKCLKKKDNLKHLKLGDCSRVNETLGYYLKRCKNIKVLHLGKVSNCSSIGEIPAIEELAIRDSKLSLAHLISDKSLGEKLRILDVRGTKWIDSDKIYQDYKKQFPLRNTGKDEVILTKLLDWMKKNEPTNTTTQSNILKIVLTDSELYYYGIAANGKGYEWWTRYNTVKELHECLRKSNMVPKQYPDYHFRRSSSTTMITSNSYSTLH